jgi:hypothetical protein
MTSTKAYFIRNVYCGTLKKKWENASLFMDAVFVKFDDMEASNIKIHLLEGPYYHSGSASVTTPFIGFYRKIVT